LAARADTGGGADEFVERRLKLKRRTYQDLAAEAAAQIAEIAPWDLSRMLKERTDVLLLDVREPAEFAALRVRGSINVPRGILEAACEWGYPETVPELARARERPVVIICRSGSRSAFAAVVMKLLGYGEVYSLRLGVRGWNDGDLPLVDAAGEPVDGDAAAEIIDPEIPPEKRDPARGKPARN
jgi:rhodanese-related sulfurtransferase